MATDVTAKRQLLPDADRLLKTQYGCGPVQFAGTSDALYERHLLFDIGLDPAAATARDRFEAMARSVRDILSQRWLLTEKTYEQQNPKRLYYLSMEFLIGRSLSNNVMNLLLSPLAKQVLQDKKLRLVEIAEQEPDAGLGNGGLGRLAACFVESAATMQLPAMGYGLRYEYGIFRQSIQNGWQQELPDNWLRSPDPWEVARPHEKVEVRLGCSFELSGGSLRPVPGRPSTLIGIPYDRPVIGYGGSTINTLRLWAAAAPDYFNLQEFSHGDFVEAFTQTLSAETLTRVLYPDDSQFMGQGLRLLQEYFLVACSLADAVRRFKQQQFGLELVRRQNGGADERHAPCPFRAGVDANPGGSGASRMGGSLADHAEHSGIHQSHPIARSAGKMAGGVASGHASRQLEIIYEINRRFLEDVRKQFPGDEARIQRVSVIEEGAGRKVRMANLAVDRLS